MGLLPAAESQKIIVVGQQKSGGGGGYAQCDKKGGILMTGGAHSVRTKILLMNNNIMLEVASSSLSDKYDHYIDVEDNLLLNTTHGILDVRNTHTSSIPKLTQTKKLGLELRT